MPARLVGNLLPCGAGLHETSCRGEADKAGSWRGPVLLQQAAGFQSAAPLLLFKREESHRPAGPLKCQARATGTCHVRSLSELQGARPTQQRAFSCPGLDKSLGHPASAQHLWEWKSIMVRKVFLRLTFL